jgi:ABC-type Mn2+/Zn2+ transport system ATPase subunit
MRILRELNAAGHTIILVTHDMQVAKMRLVLSRLVMEKLLVTVLMFQTSFEESNLIQMQHLLYKISRKKAKVFLLGVQL